MAGNKFFNNQDVYVETDYDNIIIVDPNKVVDSDGKVSERLVNHEELVMYASLEAKVLPRSKLVLGSNFDDTIQNIRVGAINRGGTVNFMKPQVQDTGDGETQDSYLDTSWTDNLTLGQTRRGDVDSQLLGISNISVKMNASFKSFVTIEMEDVQGRVLFEQGENSPYSAFFQYPYPLFTLVLKGYYGKAMRYELMLIDFNARFDPQSGNYKITINLITRTHALLADIPTECLFALPHMYPRTVTIGPNKTSTQTGEGTQEVKQIKTTKGYDMIKSVYSSYKAKGLIDENFPELTLNQMLMKMQNFENYVMQAYGKEDMSALNDIETYLNTINEYRNDIFGNYTDNWETKNIDKNLKLITNIPNDPILYSYKKVFSAPKEILNNKANSISELDGIIKKYNKLLNDNTTFGTNGQATIGKEKIETALFCDVKISDFIQDKPEIEYVDMRATYEVRNNGTVPNEVELSDFKINVIGKELAFPNYEANAETLEIEESTLLNTYFIFGDTLNSVNLKNNTFLGKLKNLEDKFKNKRQIIEEKLSIALAEKIASPDVGLGFRPTIRNVIAVISASADAFLRLMDQVHDKSWEQRENPIRVGAVMSPEKSEGIETTQVNALLTGLASMGSSSDIPKPVVYPWPQYFVASVDESGNEIYEDKYPGDPSESGKIQGWLTEVWPEIQFVEEFIKGSTEKEESNLDYDYPNTYKENPYISCNAIEFPFENQPYRNLSVIPFLYELYERTFVNSNYTKLFREGGYKDELYAVCADFENINLKESVTKSPELIELLKNFSFSYENLLKYMKSISNNGQGEFWNLFVRGNYTTPYLKSLIDRDFGVYKMSYLDGNSVSVEASTQSSEKLTNYIKSNQSDELTFSDGYPFNNLSWLQKNISQGSSISSIRLSNDTSKMFSFDENKKTLASFSNDDERYDKKMYSYFEWTMNKSTNPNQEVSTLESSVNSSGDNSFNTNAQVINYYNNRTKEKFVLTESVLDYGNEYDTTKNFITNSQTTSLLNTPYFINSILKGVENEKNSNKDPYVALGYLYLNSLPLSTLKEKFKSYNTNVTTDLNYIFATLNKFAAIHKIPYYWILKYGSIWYRYKKYKKNGVDILDDIWKDFDYKEAYDPISSNTSKSYTFNGYDNESVTIKQLEETEDTVIIDLGSEFLPPQELFETKTFEFSSVQNGFYPKVMNDIYYYFTKKDVFTGYTSNEIVNAQTNKNLKIGNSVKGSFNQNTNSGDTLSEYKMTTWSQYFTIKGNYDFRENQEDKLLIVPSFGDVKFNQSKFECFNQIGGHKQNLITNPSIYNGGVRSLWSAPNYGYFSNEMVDKPTPSQYIKHINPDDRNAQSFNLGNDTTVSYSSIDDIFGVFTEEMLDNFETYFLNFCQVDNKFNIDLVNRGGDTFTEFLNSDEIKNQYNGDEIPVTELYRLKSLYENQGSAYNGIELSEYDLNLPRVMKELFMVDSPTLTDNIDQDLKSISDAQSSRFVNFHISEALNRDVVLKIGNPEKYDNKVYGSITTVTNQKIESPYDFGNYINNSLPTQGGAVTLGESIGLYPEAWSAMTINVGEFNEDGFKYSDNGSYLTDFFVDMDYEFTEDNVKKLSSLIKIYAAKKGQDITYNKSNFIQDLNKNLTEKEEFQENVLNNIFIKLNRDLPSVAITDDPTRISKIDGNVIKLDLWKSFQTLNDKWISGQDFKERTIFEDFLFLDRANRPIGNKIDINIKQLEGRFRNRNPRQNIYGLFGFIYGDNNFTFMPTPAYTNFYGRDERVKNGLPVPQDIPNDLFGTFMEVDTRDSRPRVLGVYQGQPSTKLGMGQNTNIRVGDDSFDITNPSDCPLRENQQNKTDYSDSNRCVGFQVDFGKRNQGVFNSVSIDMAQHKNTAASYQVLEELGSQTSGQKVAQQTQSYYDIYRSASYTCQVQSLGNVMIQPTMYFNLTNVPMFYGPYLIMDVSHNISSRGFSTSFQGTRVPKFSLSTPSQLVASINRKILDSYKQRLRQIESNTPSGQTNNSIALEDIKKITQGPEDKCQEMTKYPNKDFVNMLQTNIKAQDVIDYLNSVTFNSDNIKLFIYGVATQNKAVRQNVYNNNLTNLFTNREIKPDNRTTLFNSQACLSGNEQVFPIASFNTIEDSLNFMKETYNPFSAWLDSMDTILQQTQVNDATPKTLTYFYMSQIYEIDKIEGTPQQVISIVDNKMTNNDVYTDEFNQWLDIFTSALNRGDI